MRHLVSVSLFKFITVASFALIGCSVDAGSDPAESRAEPTQTTDVVPVGQTCAVDDDCESGSCADGVCCATACDGSCEACNLEGSVGTCAPHAAGSDPEGECAVGACFEGMQESFACNGANDCDVTIVSCGAYACGEIACLSDCQSDADCVQGASCSRGRCGDAAQ